jgi:hypothetical protein
MSGDIATRAVVPRPLYPIAARDRHRSATRNKDARSADIAAWRVNLALGLLAESGNKGLGMTRREREHPSAFRTPTCDLHHHPDEVRQSEFISAEAPRLDDTIEARAQEILVGLLGQPAQPFAKRLPLAQNGARGFSAAKHFLRCQVWFRRRYIHRR